jgi:hypothetical protein
MSGVAAQGGPCTATIFWSVVRPHQHYSASSRVPLKSRPTLSYITESNHSRLSPSDKIQVQLKPSPFFSCRFLMVHISRTRTLQLNSHYQQSPMLVEGIRYIRRGAARCPEGIVCDTAVTTSVPCSLRDNASHSGFGGPEPCLSSQDVTLSVMRTLRVGFLRVTSTRLQGTIFQITVSFMLAAAKT